MTRQREMGLSGRRKLLRFRYAILALVVAACGGSLGKRTAGGESHFLETCPESCGAGLECISGLCTRSCVVDDADCSDLSPRATCTNLSIEPGRVAVCDLACDRDRDCDALGADFRCPAGFCRVPSADGPPDNPPTGGSGGGPTFEPFAPQCDPAVDFKSACSLEATCAELGCGDGFSQFGEDGCTRYCRVSSDCAEGERCRHTSLVVADEECPSPGSEVEGCLIEDGECHCSITDDCTRPSICVDAKLYPESLDCVVDTATCGRLEELEAAARRLMSSESSEVADQASQCRSRASAQRAALGCGPNPLIPFEPQCSEPVAFDSECSFDATCEQLDCGGGLSQFDENGCTRYCETSADCGAGQRCRRTRLVLTEGECPQEFGSEVERCEIVDGACSCTITNDCRPPDICVDAAEYPKSLDCAVESVSCQGLAVSELELQQFVDRVPATDATDEARACLDAIRAEQLDRACAE